jgi:hypothetical protein
VISSGTRLPTVSPSAGNVIALQQSQELFSGEARIPEDIPQRPGLMSRQAIVNM